MTPGHFIVSWLNSPLFYAILQAAERRPFYDTVDSFAVERRIFLEQIPEKLVIDVMMVLHFRRFHEGAQQARAAIC